MFCALNGAMDDRKMVKSKHLAIRIVILLSGNRLIEKRTLHVLCVRVVNVFAREPTVRS